MKKTLKVLAITALFFTLNACTSDPLEDDFNVDVQDQQSTDPDEPQPGCSNPNGCGLQS